MVEHTRPLNKRFEIIWFATKDRKRNQKYGQLLFQLIIDFACELNINKIIVTAASAAVCWWYHIGTKIKENCHLEKDHVYTKLTQSDVFQALLQSSVENGDLPDADSQRRRKRIQHIQKDFSKVKLNEKPIKITNCIFIMMKKFLSLENLIDTAYSKHSTCGIRLKNEMQMGRACRSTWGKKARRLQRC